MKTPFLVWVLIILLIFLSIGALVGGGGLILIPGGSSMGMPLEFLENTPFTSYLIPGLVLFICNGLFPLFVSYSLIKRPRWDLLTQINPFKKYHWAWTAALLSGIIVSVWIIFQVSWIGYQSTLQPIYFVYGIVIVLVTVLPGVRQYYRL